MNDEHGRLFTKIVNFVTPLGGVPVLGCDLSGHWIVKQHYSFENLLLLSLPTSRQIDGVHDDNTQHHQVSDLMKDTR